MTLLSKHKLISVAPCLGILPAFLVCLSIIAGLALRPAFAGGEIPFGQGLLWQLEKEDAPTSYLFG
ncbi:MAG: hypothetical protein R3245_05260, partial [Kiloniellales bacterium]|nr:hypothetical protein [Kiloniellales bacterium]